MRYDLAGMRRRLFMLEPSAPGSAVRRALFVTMELNQLLTGQSWATSDEAIRFLGLKADLDHFVEGAFLGPKYLKLLEPKQEQVWEIRSPNPNPSIRVFGRFALKDVFIATHHAERPSLGGFKSHDWQREINNTKTVWRNLFPTYPPLIGNSIHDYISDAADPAILR